MYLIEKFLYPIVYPIADCTYVIRVSCVGTSSPVSLGDLNSNGGCQRLNDLAKTLLWDAEGQGSDYRVPTHVAAFGNASTDEPGSWVPILTDTLPSASAVASVCFIHLYFILLSFQGNIQILFTYLIKICITKHALYFI